MSFLLNSKGKQLSIRTLGSYDYWLSIVKLLASGKAPEDLIIEGDFSLAHLRIRSLPDNLTVNGDFDLRQCQRLSRIGKNLKVKGNLLIGGRLSTLAPYQQKLKKDIEEPAFLRKFSKDGQIPLSYLPESLEVKGNLIIRSATHLRSLPNNLKVGGSLLLHGSKELKKLPNELNLNGDLILISCPNLTTLPSKLRAKRLVLIGCGVESLPYKIDIQESIHLESCPKLTSLETGLISLETGNLEYVVVDNCPIEKLPYYVTASKFIRLSKLPVKQLKDSLLEAESIRIKKCKNLERVDSLLNPSHALSFRECKKLEYFSAPTDRIRQLDLTNCESLQALPSELKFYSDSFYNNKDVNEKLILTNCFQLTQLPEFMKFSGWLEVSGCSLKTLPKKMQECRVSWRNHWVTPDIIFAPETLTPDRILTETNAEIRRLMLERVGIDIVLSKAKAATIDSDKDAGGKRSLVQVRVNTTFGQQTVRYLRCSCPSTTREYLLPVPPTTNSCKSAAAWLAGFSNPNDYQPVLET